MKMKMKCLKKTARHIRFTNHDPFVEILLVGEGVADVVFVVLVVVFLVVEITASQVPKALLQFTARQ